MTNLFFKLPLLILASLIITGFIVNASVQLFRHKKTSTAGYGYRFYELFLTKAPLDSERCLFDRHIPGLLWNKMGLSKVGIDDFLQHMQDYYSV